jgi:hypothetical protein
MIEPAGLWAVVERTYQLPGGDRDQNAEPEYLVKGPGDWVGGPYWYSIGSEHGWGWDQVTSWPGELRLVRDGVQDTAPDAEPVLTAAEEEVGRQIADEREGRAERRRRPGRAAALREKMNAHEPVLMDHPRAAEGFPAGQVCRTCGTQWPCVAEVDARDTSGNHWIDSGSGSGAERG